MFSDSTGLGMADGMRAKRATGSSVLIVEIAALQKQLADKEVEIRESKALLSRAVDALDWWARHRQYDPEFAVELKAELRKAAGIES